MIEMNYNIHRNDSLYNINPNHLHPLLYTTNYPLSGKSPVLKNQGRSLSARECQSQKSFDSPSLNSYNISKSFEYADNDDINYYTNDSNEFNRNKKMSRSFCKYSFEEFKSPYQLYSRDALPVSHLNSAGNVSPRILPNSYGKFPSNYNIKRPSELGLFQYDNMKKSTSKGVDKQNYFWNQNSLHPTPSSKIMRSTSCKTTPNRIRSMSPMNINNKNNYESQNSSSNDINIIDFLYNVRSNEDDKILNDNKNQKSSSNVFLKKATRSVSKKLAQLKMGQKESRIQKSTNDLSCGFSNSFDNSYIEANKTLEQTKKHINNCSRTNSTNSDDSYTTDVKPTNKTGSSGSLNIFTKNKTRKNDRRVQNGIRSSSATSKIATNKRNASPPKLIVLKKLTPISASSQEIIKYCMENARGDIASRIISRMAHKREDFATFITNLSGDQLNEFTKALRDYMNQVLKHVHSAEKIREISMQFGILQVSRREWGFKADFFACMANSITTECVFLDGAAHQPTEAIEAWAELVELMFTNIREGYYQQIRYLRRRSQCFSGYFSRSQDVPVSYENMVDDLSTNNYQNYNNDIGQKKFLNDNNKDGNYKHPWAMQRQMSESGCYGERPTNLRTQNFKIRVTIEKLDTLFSGIYQINNDSKFITSDIVSSRTQTSISSGYEEQSPNINLNIDNEQGTNQIIEKTSFFWGELLENNFKNEKNFIDNNDKSLNETNGDYNDDVIRRSRIFSIVLNNETSLSTVSTFEENNKPEKPILTRNTKIKPINVITKKVKIIDIPNDKQKLEGRHINQTKEEMIIKVYLGGNDKYGNNYDESQEFTIGKLLLINKRMLIINNVVLNEGLKIQSKNGFYKIYLEIIDTVILSKLSHDNESFNYFLYDVDDKISNEIDKEFLANICYHITIQKTELFPYDGVYVEYVIELPNNMSLVEKDDSILTGRTQISMNNFNGESYFSFPIQLNCFLKLTESFSSFPIIYFRICSEDEYNSFHINGYTSLCLPFKSGHQTHILPSWCPIEKDSEYSQLYSLFLGESIDIKDITKQSIKNETSSSAIGIQTESRGNLYLFVSTIIQSKHLILNDEISSLKYSAINKGYTTNLSLYMRIKKVLMDFEKARNNLLLLQNKKFRKGLLR
uniref:Uncharacterized protein n=1 Tax=Strongyloides stercoralis TaxID=6248 RepID=A0AAF5D6M9_STRER